jgi:hypothetical protein
VAKKIFGPRKQRTRAHVIADLSANHVERFVLEEGNTAQRLGSDYGYDLVVFTHDEQGYVEPGWVFIQLKAAETLKVAGSAYPFDLDIRDYNLWMLEEVPVILILFDVSRRRGYWLWVQNYFKRNLARLPKKGAKTVRVHVPARQPVNRRAIATWRGLKRHIRRSPTGEQS